MGRLVGLASAEDGAMIGVILRSVWNNTPCPVSVWSDLKARLTIDGYQTNFRPAMSIAHWRWNCD